MAVSNACEGTYCGLTILIIAAYFLFSRYLNLTPQGFVNNMSEYMAACDCVVSKAGPGTIAEAMICGVPVLLNGTCNIHNFSNNCEPSHFLGCIPCQEEGNIPFVINNRVGGYSEQPKIIASIISSWLAPENASELQLMSDRAMALGRPEATFHIVRDLAGMSVEI